jgi:hypothetical protein
MKPLTILFLLILCVSARIPNVDNRDRTPALLEMEFRWHQYARWKALFPIYKEWKEQSFMAADLRLYYIGPEYYAAYDTVNKKVLEEHLR